MQNRKMLCRLVLTGLLALLVVLLLGLAVRAWSMGAA